MSWRRAFLAQARSDYAILERLNTAAVEYAHRLHYLQMVTEKLAKAWLTRPNAAAPPAPSHSALVRMLQSLKTREEIRRAFGYTDSTAFKRFIDSLLEIAGKIERLAPASAGFQNPNPEYPWENRADGKIIAPAEFGFPELNPTDSRMQKLTALIQKLLRIAT